MNRNQRAVQIRTEFGARLRAVRKSKGMSQDEFGALLGTSKQVLSRYECGHRCPPLYIAWESSLRLGIPLDVLIGERSLDPYL